MVFITIFLYYASGFLYSATVVGPMAMMLCRYIDLADLRRRLLFYAVLVVIIVNNTIQILHFREALGAMS